VPIGGVAHVARSHSRKGLHPGRGALRASPPTWTAATATQGSAVVTVASQSSPRHASAATTVLRSRRPAQSGAGQP